MKNKKATFITIVVLLVIFLPLTVAGYFLKNPFSGKDKNPNHDLFYEGYLWFYNNDELIGKYECQTEICELTKSTIDDDTYGINYYKDGALPNIPMIEYRYAFITDGAVINLFDIEQEKVITTYKAVKDYHTPLEYNNFIVQNNDGIWGVLSIGKTISNSIPFEYDFIGLTTKEDVSNNLEASRFIVYKDNNWYMIDNTNSAISGYVSAPIIDYTAEYMVSKETDRYRFYGYNDSEYLVNYEIKDYIKGDGYLGIITGNTLYIYTSIINNSIKDIDITGITDKITFEQVDNKLNIKAGEQVLDTIEM